MDLEMEEYKTDSFKNEMMIDHYLTEVNEEIIQDPVTTMSFEECFVTGVPEDYPEETDGGSSPEKIKDSLGSVPASLAGHDIVHKLKNYLGNTPESQVNPLTEDQTKDSREIESGGFLESGIQLTARSIGPAEWADADKCNSGLTIRSVGGSSPIELSYSGDYSVEIDSLTKFSSVVSTLALSNVKTSSSLLKGKRKKRTKKLRRRAISQGYNTDEAVMKTINSKPATRRLLVQLGSDNFNEAVGVLTEDNKIWMAEDENQIISPSLLSTIAKKRSKSSNGLVAEYGENSFDDKDGATVRLADEESNALGYEDVTAMPTRLEWAVRDSETSAISETSSEGSAPLSLNAELLSKPCRCRSMYDKSYDQMAATSESPAVSRLCDCITTAEASAISTAPPPKRPSIIRRSRTRTINLRNKEVPFINEPSFNKETLKSVEESGCQLAQRAKPGRRKQVIVFKPDAIEVTDLTVTDSEEDEVVLTDTDDEAEILYDSDGSFIRCNTCHKTFDCASALTLHNRTHYGTQSFQCLECDVTFGTEFGLECHLCGQDSLSFVCKQCKRTVPSEWDVISHECADGEQMQTQTRSACKICGVNLTRRLLLRHLVDIHPNVVGQQQDDQSAEL